MTNKKIGITDTETTGISNHPVYKHPQVIQLALVELSGNLQEDMDFFLNLEVDSPTVITQMSTKFNFLNEYFIPSMEISKEAIDIHGLPLDKLKELTTAPSEVVLDVLKPDDFQYLIGHNMQFDKRCLNIPDTSPVRYLCTKKLAVKVSKARPMPKGNSLMNLIEYFYPKSHSNLTLNSHTAHYDVLKTGLLLANLLKTFPGINTYDELYQFQQVK